MVHIKDHLLLIVKSNPLNACSGVPFSSECEMVNIKDPLLLIGQSSPWGGCLGVCVVICVWDGEYKRSLAANRTE